MKRTLSVLLILGALLTGCASQSEEPITTDAAVTETQAAAYTEAVTGTVFAMDTVMDLTVYGAESDLAAAENLITSLESKLSVTDEGSEIYAINQNGSGTLSEDSADLLTKALDICDLTGGALDLSIYPVVRAWGFTTGEYGIPSDEEITELLSHVDYRNISFDESTATVTLESGMEIDLGSVAKGYTGDRVIELLRENGVTSALLNLGGNVQALGAKPDGSPWRVAIQDPVSDGYLGALEIENKAVITSGGYERYFVEDGVTYWHIIDPATGAPSHSGLISVTVIGESGILCDGLSTSLFVMGLDGATQLWRTRDDFEAVFVSEDGQVYITEGLEDSFTLLSDTAESVTVLRRE